MSQHLLAWQHLIVSQHLFASYHLLALQRLLKATQNSLINAMDLVSQYCVSCDNLYTTSCNLGMTILGRMPTKQLMCLISTRWYNCTMDTVQPSDSNSFMQELGLFDHDMNDRHTTLCSIYTYDNTLYSFVYLQLTKFCAAAYNINHALLNRLENLMQLS